MGNGGGGAAAGEAGGTGWILILFPQTLNFLFLTFLYSKVEALRFT